jgi:hypothetical protein
MEMIKWIGIGAGILWVAFGFLIHPIEEGEDEKIWNIRY